MRYTQVAAVAVALTLIAGSYWQKLVAERKVATLEQSLAVAQGTIANLEADKKFLEIRRDADKTIGSIPDDNGVLDFMREQGWIYEVPRNTVDLRGVRDPSDEREHSYSGSTQGWESKFGH